MQALRSLFSGSASQQRVASTSTVTARPVELSLAQMQQVAGGLPRVGRDDIPPVTTQTITIDPPLPRVG